LKAKLETSMGIMLVWRCNRCEWKHWLYIILSFP